MVNYTIELFDFYYCDNTLSIVLEEAENSEQNEEAPEKGDHKKKEKDKISQLSIESDTALEDLWTARFHFLFAHNSLIYLEKNTPPPEFS